MALHTPRDAGPKGQCETDVGTETAGAPASTSRHIVSDPVPQAGQNAALVAKLAEVFSADHHLHAAIFSLRKWFNTRKPGDDFGLRLLDCAFWTANLQTLLWQAQIIAKGEEK